VKVALVIPAAGSGERLGRGPKALVDVGGLSLLRRTLERLSSASGFARTVVLAPPDAVASFEAVLVGLAPSLGRISVVAGGATRQQSVAAGIADVAGEEVDIVCVHDAARPLVAAATVRAVIEAAFTDGAATAASRPADSVRQDDPKGGSSALDRSRLWLVETPQAFRREVLEAAHREAIGAGAAYTDDASLVEATGQSIRIVESVGRNLKVTVEADLRLAAELLRED